MCKRFTVREGASMTVAIIGEAIIDFIANLQGEYHPHLGGSPYNVAIGLARNGESVSYLSPFSSDNFGELMRRSLAPRGCASSAAAALALSNLPCLSLQRCEQTAKLHPISRGHCRQRYHLWLEIVAQLPADLTLLHTGSLAITPSQLPKIRELSQLIRRRSIVISLDTQHPTRREPRYRDLSRGCPLADALRRPYQGQ